MIKIDFIRVGNHWYPQMNHDDPKDLMLDPHLEKVIDHLNKFKFDSFSVYLFEITGVMPENGIVQFDENDITRYLTTTDDFDLTMFIDNHRYKISNRLFSLLEKNFNLELCKVLYKLDIW